MNLFIEGFNPVCLTGDHAITQTRLVSPPGNFSTMVSSCCSSTLTPPGS